MCCCRLRISLGLKPLSAENESDKQRKAQQEREAQKAEEDKAAKAAALAERIKACVPLSKLPSRDCAPLRCHVSALLVRSVSSPSG